MNMTMAHAFISYENLCINWNRENLTSTIINTVEVLKLIEKKNITTNMHVKLPTHIKISFDSDNLAECGPFSGTLYFGKKIFINSFTRNSFGYLHEKHLMNIKCFSREQRLLWLITHEWCHLYKNCMRHDRKFFRMVDKKYLEFSTVLIPSKRTSF